MLLGSKINDINRLAEVIPEISGKELTNSEEWRIISFLFQRSWHVCQNFGCNFIRRKGGWDLKYQNKIKLQSNAYQAYTVSNLVNHSINGILAKNISNIFKFLDSLYLF